MKLFYMSELLGRTGFLDLSNIQYYKKLENTAFQKLGLFSSSREGGRHLLCWIP
jgi:hypothetical protein